MHNFSTFPRLLNLIPHAPDNIIGRDEEVSTLRQRLEVGQPAVLVNGVGGMGKTTVALKYLAEFEAHYQHLAWVTVNTTLSEALVTDRLLVASLGLEAELTVLPPEQLYDTGCKLILHKLSQLSNSLLILDNANNLVDLLFWQTSLNSCRAHVLLTSRTEPQGWQCIKIKSLLPEQARKLFCSFYQFEKPTTFELDALVRQSIVRMVRNCFMVSIIGV